MGQRESSRDEKNNKLNLITRKYPKFRDYLWIISPYHWAACKAHYDGAEGLWRIHDNLYDFDSFIERHPGGSDFLKLSKGTDITEAFECHHLSTEPLKWLPIYYVRKAKKPRNYRFTFHDDGFYRTLKRRIGEELKKIKPNVKKETTAICDWLLLSTILLTILTAKLKWRILYPVTGLSLAFLALVSHNFLHQKEKGNWRGKLHSLTLSSYREWKLMHIFSHHIYANSLLDMETIVSEPFICFYPDSDRKNFYHKYFSGILSPIIYGFLFIGEFLKRFLAMFFFEVWYLDDILLYSSIPFIFWFFGNQSLLSAIGDHLIVEYFCGVFYLIPGLNAGHHHEAAIHHKDALNSDLDFGIYQVEAMVDRSDLLNSLFWSVTSFGHHSLHHCFPSLDHAYLPHLWKVFNETCVEFKTQFRTSGFQAQVRSHFKQLARTEPHTKTRRQRAIKGEKLD